MTMTKYEKFACDHVFNHNYDHLTFKQIIKLCKNEPLRERYNQKMINARKYRGQLIPCCLYTDTDWNYIAIILEDLAQDIENIFGEKNNASK